MIYACECKGNFSKGFVIAVKFYYFIRLVLDSTFICTYEMDIEMIVIYVKLIKTVYELCSLYYCFTLYQWPIFIHPFNVFHSPYKETKSKKDQYYI